MCVSVCEYVAVVKCNSSSFVCKRKYIARRHKIKAKLFVYESGKFLASDRCCEFVKMQKKGLREKDRERKKSSNQAKVRKVDSRVFFVYSV